MTPLLRITRRVTTALCVAFALPALGVASQEVERTVRKVNAPQEPVKITELKLKAVARGFGQKFTDGDDWLRDLTLEVKNTSDKPIVYIEIDLHFPRPERQASLLSFGTSLQYGYYPVLHSRLPPDAPRPLMPGEKAELKLSDAEHASLMETLRQIDYPASLKQVDLSVSFVIFDDNTGWNLGTPTRRDPAKPDRWVNAEATPERGASNPRPLRGLNSKRADEHGNRLRYRAKAWDAKQERAGRWARDVFLVSAT